MSSIVIKHFFKRFCKKTKMKVLLPPGLLSLNGSPLMKYLATLSLSYPICNPQCCNRRKETIPPVPICCLLVEIDPTKPESLSVSTLVVTSTVSQRSRKFMMALFHLLIMSLLFGLVFIARYFIDYHLQRTMNAFLPMEIR